MVTLVVYMDPDHVLLPLYPITSRSLVEMTAVIFHMDPGRIHLPLLFLHITIIISRNHYEDHHADMIAFVLHTDLDRALHPSLTINLPRNHHKNCL